jgi:hypothetical protein
MPTVPPDDPLPSGPSPAPRIRAAGHGPPLVRRTIVADALLDAAERERLGFPTAEDQPLPVVVELNLRHREGLTGAKRRFIEVYGRVPGERPDPDLVAPGERITSCAAGKALASVSPDGPPPDPGQVAVYVEDSGTSMAAPHVSGAVAAFLSIRREFIGQPERVKRIFLESATSLGRGPVVGASAAGADHHSNSRGLVVERYTAGPAVGGAGETEGAGAEGCISPLPPSTFGWRSSGSWLGLGLASTSAG